MSKLSIFEHFLSVGKSRAETQVVFQAKTQTKIFLLNWAPGAQQGARHQDLHRRMPPRERRQLRGLCHGAQVIFFIRIIVTLGCVNPARKFDETSGQILVNSTILFNPRGFTHKMESSSLWNEP